MSSWGTKLEQRLAALADVSSKESIQTLAKWIGFNRKHASAISSVLGNSLLDKNQSSTRQWLYWQVIHEVLMLDVGTSKWERLVDLRSMIGESAVLPAVESLRASDKLIETEKLDGLISQWADQNVFGGPTLVSQIRRLMTSDNIKATMSPSKKASSPDSEKRELQRAQQATSAASPPSDATAPSSSLPNQTSVGEEATAKAVDSTTTIAKEEDIPAEKTEKANERMSEKRFSFSKEEIKYNFEEKGIPYAKVESRDFLAPCKAIATLQIARDLRNDAAVQLSSLLSSIPEDIKQECQKAKEKQAEGETVDLPKDKARDFSIRMDERLLDMDMEEQLQTIRTFRDIVERQRDARNKLIFLLVQSRCEFGSKDAAEKFHGLKDITAMLKSRKDLLSDAMALEGLDFDTEAAGVENEQDELEPLTWYKAEESDSSNKRQKTDHNAEKGMDEA